MALTRKIAWRCKAGDDAAGTLPRTLKIRTPEHHESKFRGLGAASEAAPRPFSFSPAISRIWRKSTRESLANCPRRRGPAVVLPAIPHYRPGTGPEGRPRSQGLAEDRGQGGRLP